MNRTPSGSILHLVLLLGVLALLLTAAPAEGEPSSERRNVPLLDEPGGRALGWIADPSGLEVLERRGAWKRVRLEGWLSEGPAAALRGRVEAPAGTRILLLPPGDDGRSAAEQAAAEQLGELEARTEALRKERNRALRIQNLEEATTRYDALDEDYEALRAELGGERVRILEGIAADARERALLGASLESDGTFQLHPPGPGPYTVFVAVPAATNFPCCWADVTVGEEDVWVEIVLRKGEARVRQIRGE